MCRWSSTHCQRLIRLCVNVVLACAFVPAAHGQEAATDTTSVLVRIELIDGTVFVGTVVREDAEELVLRTQSGVEAVIPKQSIQRRSVFEGRIQDGRVRSFDPNRTRLLFSPTARPLGTGQGYFAVYELVVPFLAVGLTDRFSLAGGTVLAPGAFGRVFYIAPKLTLVSRPRLAVALGGVGLGVLVEGDGATAGIGYGLVTYGGAEHALTVGLGLVIADGEVANGAVITVGGETQVSGSLKVLTENYIIPIESSSSTEYEVVLSAGLRFFGDQLAVDFALWTSPELLDTDAFPFFPWLGFAYNFGR